LLLSQMAGSNALAPSAMRSTTYSATSWLTAVGMDVPT